MTAHVDGRRAPPSVPWPLLLSLLVLAVSLATPSIAQQPATRAPVGPYGLVRVQDVILRSLRAAAAVQTVKREAESLRQDLAARRAALARLEDELDGPCAPLSPADCAEREAALRRRTREVRQLANDYEKRLQAREQERFGNLARDLRILIRKIGEEEGARLILDDWKARNPSEPMTSRTNFVLFSADRLDDSRTDAAIKAGGPWVDITEEVLRRYDAAP